MVYIQPKAISEWVIDEPNKEFYSVSIMDNETVISAYGRYAHNSGCKIVSWAEFINGEMNQLVISSLGNEILEKVLTRLRELMVS